MSADIIRNLSKTVLMLRDDILLLEDRIEKLEARMRQLQGPIDLTTLRSAGISANGPCDEEPTHG